LEVDKIFEMELSPVMIWLGIAVLLGIIEAATVGLITIWFVFGAIMAAIAAQFGMPMVGQIILFLASSIVMLYFTRPFAVKLLKVGKTKTNAEALIGKEGLVTQEIKPYGTGEVKISGQLWTAVVEDSSQGVEKDSVVCVLRIEGVKLVVEKKS